MFAQRPQEGLNMQLAFAEDKAVYVTQSNGRRDSTCFELPGGDLFYLHLIASLHLKAFSHSIFSHEMFYFDHLSSVC